MSLQDKLDQAKKDIKLAVEVAVEVASHEIADLEKQIADSAVTYSIGDKLKVHTGGKESRMLVGKKHIGMFIIDLTDGEIIKGPCPFRDARLITQEEADALTDSNPLIETYIRTYDHRKRCKV